MARQRDLTSVAARLAREISLLEGVVAVSQGGSAAIGHADQLSDVDLYVYSDAPNSVEARAEIASRRSAPGSALIDHSYYERGDTWTDAESGVSVDIMYRDCRWIEDELKKTLELHKPSLGYSTALLFNVQTCRVLEDANGWHQSLQAWARQPYPEALSAAIVNHNWPMLRDTPFSYRNELDRCVRRRDVVNSVHVADRFLASYFDVLFALNRTAHPGEKRLLDFGETLPRVPGGLRQLVMRFVREASDVAAMDNSIETLDSLINELEPILSMR